MRFGKVLEFICDLLKSVGVCAFVCAAMNVPDSGLTSHMCTRITVV